MKNVSQYRKEVINMIAIKDMEMPKECYKCDFCHYDNSEGMDVCDITGNYISAIDGKKKRDDDCPLVEIVTCTCKDCKNRDKCRYAISNNDYAYCSGAVRK